MSRFGLLFAALLLLTACSPAPETLVFQPEKKEKLNFIFILIDDLGWTDLGCYGSDFYETPNLDRLAAQGMRFTNAYAAAPVCSPTRASILTGKYPARLNLTDWIPGRRQWTWARLLVPDFKQELPLEEITLPEALQPEGYVSASIGKWHLGTEAYYPEKQGFDLNLAGTEKGSPPSYFCPYNIPTLSECAGEEYLTDRLTEEAEAFLEQNRDKPFFLYLSHFAVHIPLQARAELVAKYAAKLASLQATGAGGPQLLHKHPVYAAMIESMDQSVGRILAKLDQLQIAERTVVFFTSDNGGLLYEGKRAEPVTSNAPLRAGKGHLYEGGVREPLIVRWPGATEPGSLCDVPVTSVDFFPTTLDIAGVEFPAEVTIDGESVVPLLLSQTDRLTRPALFWHYPHYSNQGGEPAGAVRQDDYKLIEFYADGKVELYNLREDIGEEHDLATAMPGKVQELRERLEEWRTSLGAQMPKTNPEYDPKKADQGLTGAQRRVH